MKSKTLSVTTIHNKKQPQTKPLAFLHFYLSLILKRLWLPNLAHRHHHQNHKALLLERQLAQATQNMQQKWF